VPDSEDAFANDPSESKDTDKDGIGDNADKDRDGDGVANEVDVFADDATESKDSDHDGIGDNADKDRDGDRVPTTRTYFQTIRQSGRTAIKTAWVTTRTITHTIQIATTLTCLATT